MIRAQRGLEAAGRGLLWAGVFPPAWIAGTAALSLSKILDNMEIGHNVMHGQYDWMNDPALSGKEFEWDNACPADQWRHSHNYMHHTHTNIVGKDRDIGYGVLRMSEDQRWRPYYLGNPVYAALLATALPVRGRAARPRSRADPDRRRRRPGRQAQDGEGDLEEGPPPERSRTTSSSRPSPARSSLFPLAGNATANLVRNVWSFTIIFCGHFPEGTHEFTEEETENESRGQWYYRQLLGSANLSGSRPFHILAGNLSFQIEHHLFPDLPGQPLRRNLATRSARSAAATASPTTSARCGKQFGSVVKKILRLALPPAALNPKGIPFDGLGGAARRLAGAVKKTATQLRP